MVRERTSFRDFQDHFFLPPEAGGVANAIAAIKANGAPLEVDLGCGRGRFLLERAKLCPSHFFIGVERILLRLRKIDARAAQKGIPNIRLIRSDIRAALRDLIPDQIVNVFYLYFPDPWPKRRHHNRRIVSPEFIQSIHDKLAAGGIIHLCTDHPEYFRTMERAWGSDTRFRQTPPLIPGETEETDFGLIFRRKGLPIYRCSFQKGPPASFAATPSGS